MIFFPIILFPELAGLQFERNWGFLAPRLRSGLPAVAGGKRQENVNV